MGELDNFKHEVLQRLVSVETNLSILLADRPTLANEISVLKEETSKIKELTNICISRSSDLNSRITSLTTFAVTFITFVIGLVFALK